MIDKTRLDELINKCNTQAETLLKVIQHPESTEDEVIRTSVARRFVLGFKKDLELLVSNVVFETIPCYEEIKKERLKSLNKLNKESGNNLKETEKKCFESGYTSCYLFIGGYINNNIKK